MKEEAVCEAPCNGFEALYYAAIDSNVTFITGVPGYPVTSLMELFLKTDNSSTNMHCSTYKSGWLTNEKVALEIALGASVSGRRSLVLVKHVGMNLLSDPLITSVTHTIGAGMVIIAGDDPGAKGSQNEQDSRWYGKIAEVAVFDPSSPEAAYRILRRAYELSEENHVPVVVRVTAGLEKSNGIIRRLPAASAPHPEFDRSIWNLRMMEKHRHFHSKVYPMLEEEAENTDLNEIRKGVEGVKGAERIGIISSGFASALVEDFLKKSGKYQGIFHLVLNLVNPLPMQKIGVFLKDNQKVLVVEESEPFIEEQIRIAGNICGKKTGHLPYGRIVTEDIEFALEHVKEEKVSRPADSSSIESRKRGKASICEDCPYLPLYHLLRNIDVRIAGDMGCSVRSAPEPLAAVDVSFALGSAISVACGFEKKGIAVIGDFALAHSGILGLLNAASEGYEVLVLVLQNEVAAMTGGQKVPDLRKVVEAIVQDVSVFDMGGKDGKEGTEGEKETENKIGKAAVSDVKKQSSGSELDDLIEEKLGLPGISVIFIKGICRKF